MLEYIPYFIANIFQSGAYAICMLYLTGELSQQKKHLWSTCISFFLMYWLTITIQLHDDDWIVIGLFLILCVYFLFVYFLFCNYIIQIKPIFVNSILYFCAILTTRSTYCTKKGHRSVLCRYFFIQKALFV